MNQVTVETWEVIPVAGHDSMLLNLSGAHAPLFTRNLVKLTDSEGRVGIGEVPGGESIRSTLVASAELIEGTLARISTMHKRRKPDDRRAFVTPPPST